MSKTSANLFLTIICSIIAGDVLVNYLVGNHSALWTILIPIFFWYAGMRSLAKIEDK